MVCSQCYGFVFDFLVFPPDISQQNELPFRVSRFKRIAPEVAQMTMKILMNVSIAEYNLCEQADPEKNLYVNLNRIAGFTKYLLYYRALRLYKVFLQRNPTLLQDINQIYTLMMEHCIFSKEFSINSYQDWFGNRFMYLLQHIHSLHQEHSGLKAFSDVSYIHKMATPTYQVQYIDVDEADDLYT